MLQTSKVPRELSRELVLAQQKVSKPLHVTIIGWNASWNSVVGYIKFFHTGQCFELRRQFSSNLVWVDFEVLQVSGLFKILWNGTSELIVRDVELFKVLCLVKPGSNVSPQTVATWRKLKIWWNNDVRTILLFGIVRYHTIHIMMLQNANVPYDTYWHQTLQGRGTQSYDYPRAHQVDFVERTRIAKTSFSP